MQKYGNHKFTNTNPIQYVAIKYNQIQSIQIQSNPIIAKSNPIQSCRTAPNTKFKLQIQIESNSISQYNTIPIQYHNFVTITTMPIQYVNTINTSNTIRHRCQIPNPAVKPNTSNSSSRHQFQMSRQIPNLFSKLKYKSHKCQ